MFKLSVEGYFSAAHQVRGYPGDCADIHGHTYKIQVSVEVAKLDEIGMGVDFRKLKDELQKVLEGLDHKNLNTLPFFEKHNATAEYVAKYIFDQMKEKIENVIAVTVWEGPDYSVTYSSDET
ncbi:MAG: 6-carboxytetrahydropterin synthase QueD [candidate division WOR-3 bacterium]|nr:MAG: 6-carboxytetrahydropterin synthase QueD [candidate division WOR-3 bacterium]